jgi:hypothetical protein
MRGEGIAGELQSLFFTTALTLSLSPKERGCLCAISDYWMIIRPIQPLVFPKTLEQLLPRLEGEGRGEDGRSTDLICF